MSEFGAGIVVCLAKFSEHLSPEAFERWKKASIDFSDALELQMNGASDHFYDLDRNKSPPSLIKLADLTLEIGHDSVNKEWTKKDLFRIRNLWQKSCEELDLQLGTKPDWGEW